MVPSTHDILSVFELNRAIKNMLEPAFYSLKVKGEVSDAKLQSSGHEYFTIKDYKSQISCVLFKGSRSSKDVPLRPGDQIIVEGGVSLYEPRGQYQIVARRITRQGVGDLLAKIHELKKELEALGWLSSERKKKIPPFPARIGVVTSPTGSVIRDIIHVLSRRFSGFELILYPVKVQGAGAAEEIAQAIDQMNSFKLADVLIVGRGGGSLEDLMPFNERCVAESIFKSTIPIISAVGHETDFCIADFVADQRAPTPSAAAEIATAEKAALLSHLERSYSSLLRSVTVRLASNRRLLQSASLNRAISNPMHTLNVFSQKLDDISSFIEDKMQLLMEDRRTKLENATARRLLLSPRRQIGEQKQKLVAISERLLDGVQKRITSSKQLLASAGQMTYSLNPKKLLSRGYCIPFAQKDKSVIISTKQVHKEDSIYLMISDGTIHTKVTGVLHHEN